MNLKRMSNFKFLFSIIIILLTQSCKENSNLPVLTTVGTSEITQTSAISGGNITSDGGSQVISRGVCWNTSGNPTLDNEKTIDGTGTGSFTSNMSDLEPGTIYYVKSYATNNTGTAFGNEELFKTKDTDPTSEGQIIADHAIVSDFDKIPPVYLNLVKRMWVVIAGESHSYAYRRGAEWLEAINPAYQVNATESGTPEEYTDKHLRISCATWGNYNNESGWIYDYGEEDWFTNSTAINRTKAGITYCNTNNLSIAVIGFAWCWDMVYGNPSTGIDPIHGCHWFGTSRYGPDGDKAWGLDSEDFSNTGNGVSMDTYLNVTEEYRKFCETNGYPTKVIFTTGPVEEDYTVGEAGYQGYIKHEYIRNFVKTDPQRILFDYADILCYDDNGAITTATWNGHTFPRITPTNLSNIQGGHIGKAGAIRLAKAMWWMLARIAGWDGK